MPPCLQALVYPQLNAPEMQQGHSRRYRKSNSKRGNDASQTPAWIVQQRTERIAMVFNEESASNGEEFGSVADRPTI